MWEVDVEADERESSEERNNPCGRVGERVAMQIKR